MLLPSAPWHDAHVETSFDPAFASPVESKSGIFISAANMTVEAMLKLIIKQVFNISFTLWLRTHIICRACSEINDLMKNPFKNTAFLFGVTNAKNLPNDCGIEVLLSGRSNAGKSSALNSLAENKKLARISKTPGRTTEINFFEVEEGYKLLDLPGYGFAKSGRSRIKDWGSLLGEYFANRKALKGVLIFMDIRHPLKPIDLEMIKLCESFDTDYVAVLTKSDKVSKNISAKTIQQVSEAINAKEILAISSLNKTGFEKLRKVLIGFKYE